MDISLCSLDLDKWIYEPPSESEEDTKDDNLSFLLPSGGGGTFGGASGGLSGMYGDMNHSPTDSPKGKKKRKKRSKAELEEEEEMKRVSCLVCES